MEYVERTFAYFTKNVRGHDAKLFTRGPAFASFPEATLTITSADCGPSNSKLDVDHTQDGKDLLPILTWTLPSTIPVSEVKEYLVVIEDADVPLPSPIMHAAFFGLPPTKTELKHEDLERTGTGIETKGGFSYAQNLRNKVYAGPRPLRGHGPHRYFYQVIALKESLGKLDAPVKKDTLVKSCEGKVLGWGEWVGVAERP